MSHSDDETAEPPAWDAWREYHRARFYIAGAIGVPSLLAALMIWGVSWGDRPQTWSERPHRFVETDVRLAAAELQEEAPRMVDRHILLSSVTADRREVIQIFQVDETFERYDAEKMRAEREAALRREACEDPRMRSIIARGGRFSWRYSFSRGQRFTVSVSSCPEA